MPFATFMLSEWHARLRWTVLLCSFCPRSNVRKQGSAGNVLLQTSSSFMTKSGKHSRPSTGCIKRKTQAARLLVLTVAPVYKPTVEYCVSELDLEVTMARRPSYEYVMLAEAAERQGWANLYAIVVECSIPRPTKGTGTAVLPLTADMQVLIP